MTDQRGHVIDHLTAARMALEAADSTSALDHIRAATRLIGESGGLCDATAAVMDTDESTRHYRHSPGGTFGHVCTSIGGHDAAHLCSCGYTWIERWA